MTEVAAQSRRRVFLSGIRTRILFWYVLVLAVAITAAVLVMRQVLVARIDRRIDESLVQEAEELRRLSVGRDPTTGRPFGGDVERIFDVFLRRNIPTRTETFVTFVEGRPYQRSFREPPYRIDRDRNIVRRVARASVTERGSVDSPAGRIEFLAVPVLSEESPSGVFVAAVFRDLELDELQPALVGGIGVGIATLLIGSILAWRVAEGVLRPVRAVTQAAGNMSTGDLTQRIPVTGQDEISHLATTFNAMLDRLEEAFTVQRDFVNDAGHELRTPITVIRGHLELLDDDRAERERTIALVMDELERMQRIVEDLLLLAKAERPDFLSLSTVDVGELTRDVHANATALAPREWQLEGVGRGRIVADRQRVAQALMQLAQNAADHAPPDAEIGLGSAVSDGYARFWVRDTGPPIPRSDRERIFQRFGRVGRRARSQGAGLGLSIVDAIAQAHHGRVGLETGRNAGNTFSISIPVDQPVQTEKGETWHAS